MKASVVYCVNSNLIKSGLRWWLYRNPVINKVRYLDLSEEFNLKSVLMGFRSVDLLVLHSEVCEVFDGIYERIMQIKPELKIILIAGDGLMHGGIQPHRVLKLSISEHKFHQEVQSLLGFEIPSVVNERFVITDHEADVLRLVCMEYNNEQIADALSRSKRTIEGTRTRIMRKLGVKSSVGLVKYALKVGIYSVV